MITIRDFMEIANYRITEGSSFTWNCFGNNAYSLDCWSPNEYSLSIIFDTQTQLVYEVQAHDYKNNRSYRLTNEEYVKAQQDEATSRNVDIDQAYDEVRYVDLESEEDFMQKALAIAAGEDYDTRVSIPVDFTDEELLKYMKLAH